MTNADDYTHCPNCLAEHRAGYTICTECGSLLVPGPSPAQASDVEAATRAGGIEVVQRERSTAEGPDRFALEETPIVLAVMAHEDSEAFLAALDEQEIGARRGADTDDGGVGIVVHAANLIDAQAVLVEFTGDVSLVDEIPVEADGDDDAWAVVTWVPLGDAGVRANRLAEQGLHVRLELPPDGERAGRVAQAAILVAIDDVEEARRILGIEL